MDLAINPELSHALIDRLVTAHMQTIDQITRLNLWDIRHTNVRIGSGGYGYTTHLPGKGFDPAHVKTGDKWGCATAQIFSEVSPAMHQEFAVNYEKRVLDRFGLVYYGCCEPLHGKLDVLKTIPNLRKISLSPWADVQKMTDAVGGKYVFSIKPNPAFLARDDWRPDQIREDLQKKVEITKGCPVEIILKDISTVHNQPHRLAEWARMARDVIDKAFIR